jgi:hypothetical protein
LNDEVGLIEQIVTVNAQTPFLTYWHQVRSSDVCGYDVAGVIIDNGRDQDATVLDGFWMCRSTATTSWRQRTVDLRPYIGQTIVLGFLGGTDEVSLPSSWFVDDIALQTPRTAAPAETADAAAFARVQLVYQGIR